MILAPLRHRPGGRRLLRLQHLTIEALDDGLITEGRFAGYLGVDLLEARGLLEESEQSIAAISEVVEYGSEVAFRKAFSAYVGVPLGQYRRDSQKV